MGDVTETAVDDVPMEYRERFSRLLREKPRAIGLLRQDLANYVLVVRQVSKLVTLFNPEHAAALTRVCTALLDLADPLAAGDPRRRLVQASVQYFILEEEDEEITGVLGFDDDIQVVNAACRALGRLDLLIPWQPALD